MNSPETHRELVRKAMTAAKKRAYTVEGVKVQTMIRAFAKKEGISWDVPYPGDVTAPKQPTLELHKPTYEGSIEKYEVSFQKFASRIEKTAPGFHCVVSSNPPLRDDTPYGMVNLIVSGPFLT